MVSTNLSSRSELKKYLRDLFKYIEEKDYSNALDASKKLHYSLKTYYMTRGKDSSRFADLFSKLDYLIVYCTDCDMKTDILLESLKEIVDLLREVKSDPLDQLKELYDEILNLYININKENANSLLDSFDEIRQLRSKIRELGGPGWVYYCSALQQLSICESAMMRIIKAERIPSSLLAEIEGKFGDLFVALNGVLSPSSLNEKQIQDAYGKGVPLEEISFGTGESTVDLQKMLQEEEIEENSEL